MREGEGALAENVAALCPSFFFLSGPPLSRCGEHLSFAACSARNIAKKNAGANLRRTINCLFAANAGNQTAFF